MAAVQDFYERYPYPPPLDDLASYQRRWQDPNRRRADFHLFRPEQAYTEERTILVAGCGTSQAAKHAARCPAARVVGIDFSATSVRHTEDLKRRHDLANLEVHQLSIEQVGELGLTFDEIVCTGVLHHLPEPGPALRALRMVLNDDGAIHLMVYAPYGRAGIYLLQQFCRTLGLEASDDTIRDLTVALDALPAQHPLARLLREAPDFRDPAALADAILNPQDRAYSVPQFMDLVRGAGLRFGRWIRQAPYSARCGTMVRLPQARRLSALDLDSQFAAAELFRGGMLTHSAVVYRDDHRAAAHAIDFSGDAWPHYIPIRAADTITIEDRLPPGAAAVLINRAHTDTDLYLPIDAREKFLLDRIDGTRSIRDIDEGEPGDVGRALFEKLWWHDQVVFDTAQPR